MGRKGQGRVTSRDIEKAGGLKAFIKLQVKRAASTEVEVTEVAASMLSDLARQSHFEHARALYDGGAVKPLVLLLSSGSAKAQGASASALHAITHGKRAHQKAALEAGAVVPLVKLIRTGSAKVQEEAASTLASLNADVADQKDIIAAGAIPPLVGLLRTGSAAAQAFAAQALANAASYDAILGQDAIAKAGAVPLLLALLGVGAAQTPAAGALSKLAHQNARLQDEIAKEGGIAPLLSLLNGRSTDAQVQAAAALAEVARGNEETQFAVAKAGGISPVLALLASRSPQAQARGMGALAQLAHNNRENQDAIARQGGIKPLVNALEADGSDPDVQAHAAFALMEITRGNREIQDAVVAIGGIGHLSMLMQGGKKANEEEESPLVESVKAEVAGALWSLSEASEIKAVMASKGVLEPLVKLLGLGRAERARWHAAKALSSLALENHSNQVAITRLLIELLSLQSTEAGGVPVNNTLAQQRSVDQLWTLQHENPDAHQVFATAGDPAALVELLKEGLPDSRDYALWALSLSISADNQSTVAECGGVQPLIDQLGARRPKAKEQAAAALAKLARNNEETCAAVVSSGAVKPLINLLATTLSGGASPQVGGVGRTTTTTAAPVATKRLPASEDGRDTTAAAAPAPVAVVASPVPTRISLSVSSPSRALMDAKSTDAEAELVLMNTADAIAQLANDTNARDEIVAEGGIRPLVLLLQGNENNTKNFAATALGRLSNNHEPTQMAIAHAGAIAPLAALLDGREGPEAQQEAAGALFSLADHPHNRNVITEANGIGLLVSLLASDNTTARVHAEGALVKLSIETTNRALIIMKLVDMLHMSASDGSQKDGTEAAPAEAEGGRRRGQEQAAAALANLARESEENRHSIVDANGISPLLALLDSDSGKAKENSVSAITELCRKSKENQAAIAKAGGVPKLVGVLLGFSNTSVKDAEVQHLCTLAASAIKEMAKGNQKNQDMIFQAGAIPPLVSMLGAPVAQMQANAAGALANLARNHPDNQAAIARTGAVAPLCTLVREGVPEAKDRAASAIWSLATDNPPNKDTIAKLGGIDPLLGLLVTGQTEKSQECVAGALAALAAKHIDNRALIAKRLVGLLGSAAAKEPSRAVRVLMTCSSFVSDSTANQISFAKTGGIPPLIVWVNSTAADAQASAAQAMLCLSIDNTTTQSLIAKSNGIPPLIALVKRSSPAAQEYAARALWHLASIPDHQAIIAESGGIKPLVSLLLAEAPETAAEIAAVNMVRLMRVTPAVSQTIADKGGIVPLVSLLTKGTPGATQQAAAALAELALVPKNRDMIADAGGIMALVKLLESGTIGTPETAARAMAHLSLEDETGWKLIKKQAAQKAAAAAASPPAAAKSKTRRGARGSIFHKGIVADEKMHGCEARRAMMHLAGGIQRLITLLDASNLTGKATVYAKSINLQEVSISIGMQEQGAATIADIAFNSAEMQDAIIAANGVQSLLTFIRNGSSLGQEHAARAIRNLSQLTANQTAIVECGTIPELVQLARTGSQKAQELAAAGLSELASGAIAEREMNADESFVAGGGGGGRASSPTSSRRSNPASPSASRSASPGPPARHAGAPGPAAAASGRDRSVSPVPSVGGVSEATEGETTDRLVVISEAGGIPPLVMMLSSISSQARENAAGALMHLALDPTNAIAIAKALGIAPLVTILDDGTDMAHQHAAEALLRLSKDNVENQTTAAKYLVALLASENPGAQRRASMVISDLSNHHPGSPVIIVNAGAISPLVLLLSTGKSDVVEQAGLALSNLSLNSPSTQLAIATGLVGVIASPSAASQENVTQLLLVLSDDASNRVAISQAGAIPRLIIQLRGSGSVRMETSLKAQELAAAVMSRLTEGSDENVDAIASSSGIRPLVGTLSSDSPIAQAHAAAVLSDLAKRSTANRQSIINEGGITPLVSLLDKQHEARTKAEASGALLSLSEGQPETQKLVAEVGAIKMLVAILNEKDDHSRRMAAGAIAALCNGSRDNQDAVDKHAGVGRLVGLLGEGVSDDVRAEAAAALAVLAGNNQKIQDKVTAAGGIEPLVKLLQGDEVGERAKEEAAAALWSLAARHYDNQVNIANADGIAPLVAVLGLGSVRAQEQAAGALASLALDNRKNEDSIAKMIVSLLGSDDKEASAKAARAISRLARAHPANQKAIASAGGIVLLVNLLDTDEEGQGRKESKANTTPPPPAQQSAPAPAPAAPAPLNRSLTTTINTGAHLADLEMWALLQREMAAAIWSMAMNNAENQVAIAHSGGIPLLIALLGSSAHLNIHRDVAGALWHLAGNPGNGANQAAIATAGGIAPLVGLLKTGAPGVQETSAGALYALGESAENRVSIAAEGGIPLLVALLDKGSEEAKEQAAGALQNLVISNEDNQKQIANGLVELLRVGSATAQEHVTQLLRNLAHDPENRASIAKAGAVPELVGQLEKGSAKAMGMAAGALAFIALRSAEHRATVTQELVKLLASNNEAVRQRASEALRDMAAGGETSQTRAKGGGGGGGKGGGAQTQGLVNLLKDGLKDGRVEAQEYALWSLSSITDAASREQIVQSGGIQPLIASLKGGKLSSAAQEHAATVLSGLAPMAQNAQSIKEAKGIDPLVLLLSVGNADAKEHAANALAQLARLAEAANEIAGAGGVSAFVGWLNDPTLGPPKVAASALSEIALDNPDTQAQIAEEGAISPLIAMVRAWGKANAAAEGGSGGNQTSRGPSSGQIAALKNATVAAGALATLAKKNVVNQITMMEEDGIPPLLELLKDKTCTAHENASMALWFLGALEDNQTAIALAGGVPALVALLTSENDITQQYTAAALESLSKDHPENQVKLAQAGAIEPLVHLLGSESKESQEHAVGALLYITANDEESRNAVVQRLVAVLDMRNAAAQMKAAEALAVIASRSGENRKAITAAKAIEPLVRLLGDGRRVRAKTAQERAAAVLADLSRLGENKVTIVTAGGVPPLVAMLSSESPKAQAVAACNLWHLASIGTNKSKIVEAGGIPPLVTLISSGSAEAKKYSTGALWHLAAIADNKQAMVNAGAIPPVVAMLEADSYEAREFATGVISSLARSQGGNKKAIYQAHALKPLIALLTDESIQTQKHAACALWGLADGKEGIYDKQMVEQGAVAPLIDILLANDPETRGFAAACLSSCCEDVNARQMIVERGGAEPLIALAHSPTAWLRSQALEMLKLLGVPYVEQEQVSPVSSPRMSPKGGASGRLRSIAQKTLPIRLNADVDPEKENPRLGELLKGDLVFVIERREVMPGIVRALVEPTAAPGTPHETSQKDASKPKGWVTFGKDGVEYLVSEMAIPQSQLTGQMKMKFKFFSFQLGEAGFHLK